MATKVPKWMDATGVFHDTKVDAEIADTVVQIITYLQTSREAWSIDDAQFAKHAEAFHALLSRYLRLKKKAKGKAGE